MRREPRPRMTAQEIRTFFDKLADVVCVLSAAAPNDKSEISCQLDLKLTYQPGGPPLPTRTAAGAALGG